MMRRFLLLIPAVLCCLSFICSCEEQQVTVAVSGISLNTVSISMTEGETAVLSAVVSPSNATNKLVLWSTGNINVAEVDASGRVSAKSPGTTVISAKTDDGGFVGRCTVTVMSKSVAVTGVSIDKREVTLMDGESITLKATVLPENASNKNISWRSGDESVVTVSYGTITAKKVGTATVSVVTEDGGKTAECKVTVEGIPVSQVTLDKSSVTLVEGETITLKAAVLPENASNKNISWHSGDESVVTVSDGTVTARKVGTATVTVVTEEGGKTAECKVTVEGIPVSQVTLDKSSVTLVEGESITLKAAVLPENAANKNISWRSGDESVVTVSDGTVTAKKVGTATVTVVTEDGGKTAECKVTVEGIPVSQVTLDKNSVTLLVGESLTLKATVLPENAANKNVKWSSSDNTVVSVDNGVVTALRDGTATISAVTEDGGKKAQCRVTVKYVSLLYGDEAYKSSWGLSSGGNDEWGVMFPPEMLSSYSGMTVSCIKLFSATKKTVTVKMYQGGTTGPETLIVSKNVSLSAGCWHIFSVSPFVLNTKKSLWVSLSCSYSAGTHPSEASEGVNNRNARWKKSSDGSWYDACDYNGKQDLCWMIQALLSCGTKSATLTYAPSSVSPAVTKVTALPGNDRRMDCRVISSDMR